MFIVVAHQQMATISPDRPEIPLLYDAKTVGDESSDIALARYKVRYAESISNPELFWTGLTLMSCIYLCINSTMYTCQGRLLAT